MYRFEESEIKGIYEIYPNYFADNRGSVVKSFHKESFEDKGIFFDVGETLLTTNLERDTIRGFHFQYPPYAQAKIFYCVSGLFYNYSLDLRVGSPTYGKVIRFKLDSENKKMLYTPEGIANANRVLEEKTIVSYSLTSKYMPEYDGGVRWDSLGVDFGVKDPIISSKDAALPKFEDLISPFIYKEKM